MVFATLTTKRSPVKRRIKTFKDDLKLANNREKIANQTADLRSIPVMQTPVAGGVRETESGVVVESDGTRLEVVFSNSRNFIRGSVEPHAVIAVFGVSNGVTSDTGGFSMAETPAIKEGAAGICAAKI